MITQTLESKEIETLREFEDLIPVTRDTLYPLPVRVFDRKLNACRNYLSAHRREFYKIMMVTEGVGLMTIGRDSYYVEEPTILFLHPSDIVTWKRLSEERAGYSLLFKKSMVERYAGLKALIEKQHFFTDKSRNVIRLKPENVAVLNTLFVRMKEEEVAGQHLNEDMIQTYLQQLLIECARLTNHPAPDMVSEEFGHVHEFFRLLEEETAHINYSSPITIKTAKEFAASMDVHPNYLNLLLKKHTGQNVSTHIRNRLVEAAKALLLQTNWSLQDVGYSIGFAEQSNFNLFFKKNTGFTPAKFRKENLPVLMAAGAIA